MSYSNTTRPVPLDPAREPEFVRAFKKFGIDCHLQRTSYWSYWALHEEATDMHMNPSYDLDVDKILGFLRDGVPFVDIDYMSAHPKKIRHAPGVPLCIICAQPGGLPCPKVAATAHRRGIILAAPGVQLHPGRCLKKLKGLIAIIEGKRP